MTKYADIFEDSFKTIIVTFTGAEANDDNFEVYLSELKSIYEKKCKLAIIFDATMAVYPETKYQKIQAKWLKDNTILMTTFCAGTAYIIPNKYLRAVLKAIFAFQRQPIPYVVCKTLEEAQIWTNQKLND